MPWYRSQGLHVTFITAELPSARGNTTALADFRARTDLVDGLSDATATNAHRFELLEHKAATAGGIATFSATVVHWQRPPSVTLPWWLEPGLQVVATRRLRTVFPERSRWRPATPTIEPGGLGEVGRLALLVQQSEHKVDAQAVDAFRRGWVDLGYNALGETGVVRCDLLQDDDDPTAFVARKVFRHRDALTAHEASPHYARWLEAHAPMLRGQSAVTLLDTLYPRTSVFPFRSRWATA